MYNTIQFEAQGNQEVQLTLIKSSIDNWSEQFRINVKLDDTKNSHTINLNDLKNSLGSQFLANDIQSIAISLIGDEKSSISYNLEVNNIKFINQDDLVNDKFINLDIFPNPARNHIIINMESSENKAALVSVIDISGKVRNQFSEYLLRGTNQINLDITSYERGIYLIDVTSNGKTYQSKIIKK